MKEFMTENIRNVALIGHGNSGKTSLASAFLFDAGAVNRLTKVEQGNTITDYDSEEIERKITIFTALANLEWNNHKINLLDTPGYGNFLWDTKAALRVSEGAIVMVDATAGVEVQTEKGWSFAAEYGVSRMIAINKIDRERASFANTMESIHDFFGRSAVPVQIPIGQEASFKGVVDLIKGKAYLFTADESGKMTEAEIPADLKGEYDEARQALVEMVAEQDESIMNKYLEEGDLSGEDIMTALKKGVASGELAPVFILSAAKNMGVQPLLDAMVSLIPSPAQKGSLSATLGGKEAPVKVDAKEPFSGIVFKTLSDPYAGRINLLKIVSGVLAVDATVANTSREIEEKITSLAFPMGKQLNAVEKAYAGDIIATSKLKETLTGETLAAKERQVILDPIVFPASSISFALEPKTRQDEDKLSTALVRITEEDPTVKFKRDPQTKELIISGNGQLHIEILVARLKKKFNVDVILKPPKIAYLETIKGKADVEHKHKKQTGGRGQYGHVKIRLEPLPRGEDFEFSNDIFGGAIPKNYVPSVEKGIQDARLKGVLAGYPTVDFKVSLYDGSYHEVDSSDMAFKIAASRAFKKGAKEAKPTLLEPIANVEIYAPEELLGDIMGNLNGRRGKPLGTDKKGKISIIKAQVPLVEMLDFEPTLTSITGGRGSYTMEFSHYEEVPGMLQPKVIEAAAKEGRTQEEEED